MGEKSFFSLNEAGHTVAYNDAVCRSPSSTSKVSRGIAENAFEAAVVAGGKHVSLPHEAWIAADPVQRRVRLLITGPHGFERTVSFAVDDDPAVITDRVRETLEE